MSEYELFLKEIAEKLGTTVEGLWAVMVGQAPISATADAVVVAMCVAVVLWGFRFVTKKTTEVAEGERFPDWDGEGKLVAWLAWVLSALIAFVCITSNAELIIAGYLNPEYWALMKLKG